MKRLILAVAALLSASTAAASPSLDGYTFERAEFYHPTIQLTFVPVSSDAEIRRLAAAAGIHLNQWSVKSFSTFSGTSCTIYAEDPRLQYEPEFIGHELTHCIFGDFHPQQSKRIK